MNKTFTCVLCPNSCEVNVEYRLADSAAGEIVIERISGNHCPKGRAYAEQELLDPRRTIATSVLVEGGERPLVSVRLTAPIPKDRIMDAMALIRRYKATAPVKAGTVVIRDLFGLGSDVIVTKTVMSAE